MQKQENDNPEADEKHDERKRHERHETHKDYESRESNEDIPAESKTSNVRQRKQRGKPAPDRDDRFEVEGILELAENGFGFLRFNNFLTSEKDIYVAPAPDKKV